VLEKDVVLALARTLRAELEHQGWKVLLTREGNDNPSFDDRAALANAQRGALFLTLHVSSTGPVGTVRSYYLSPEELRLANAAAAPTPGHPGWVSWEQAQVPSAELSRRFAELLQVQLALKFRGSPEVPSPSAVRQLRMVTFPAVAVEISSVGVSDAKALESMAPDLAAALAHAVQAFRPLYQGGGK
jgi:N-acetylmuramoyl-L-alanine amidase